MLQVSKPTSARCCQRSLRVDVHCIIANDPLTQTRVLTFSFVFHHGVDQSSLVLDLRGGNTKRQVDDLLQVLVPVSQSHTRASIATHQLLYIFTTLTPFYFVLT